MYIRAIKLVLNAEDGIFGFVVPFSRNLTIIKGKNSSGKSTLINSLLYGLGMEELIGGRGEKMLPYAVKDYFELDNKKISVLNSEVYLEIENDNSDVITTRRSIKSLSKSNKLIEISDSASITTEEVFNVSKSTYLHDPGSAQIDEGFYKYFEKFIGIELPKVPLSSGGEAKLYLQTIFAALAVEQKRGWSDYIAGIPFYGIREARLRVVEFILGLNVFAANALKSKLDGDSIEIANSWNVALRKLQAMADDTGATVIGIPSRVTSEFDENSVYLQKLVGREKVSLGDYIEGLRNEYTEVEEKAIHFEKSTSEEVRENFDSAMQEVQKFTNLYESISAQQSLNNASLMEYEQLFSEAKGDLAKNKAALKLKDLGARNSFSSASDICPTCHQHIEDSLLLEIVSGPQMDLETNIKYLERQANMLEKQIGGIRAELLANEVSKAELSRVINSKKEYLNAIRMDFSTSATQSRANIKRQVQIDDEINKLEKLEEFLVKSKKDLKELSNRLVSNQNERKQLPSSTYSDDDERKISVFEKYFRANASAFGYESAPIDEIEINRDTLTPFLSSIELRSLNFSKTDIKADSSASDFVRLIWSYLLGLHQASVFKTVQGNHPNILIFDEPGQHSMAASSQHALLQSLSSEKKLQSIVAASFDESEPVFKEATENVDFSLIKWDTKSIELLT